MTSTEMDFSEWIFELAFEKNDLRLQNSVGHCCGTGKRMDPKVFLARNIIRCCRGDMWACLLCGVLH